MKEFKGIWILYGVLTDNKLNNKEKRIYNSQNNIRTKFKRNSVKKNYSYVNTPKQIRDEPINLDSRLSERKLGNLKELGEFMKDKSTRDSSQEQRIKY